MFHKSTLGLKVCGSCLGFFGRSARVAQEMPLRLEVTDVDVPLPLVLCLSSLASIFNSLSQNVGR